MEPSEPIRPVDPNRPRFEEEAPLTGRVLAARPGRYGRQKGGGDDDEARRRGETKYDPPGTMVLTLLVPEGRRLPSDIGSGRWELVLTIRPR